MRILAGIDLGEEEHDQVANWTRALAVRLKARADLMFVLQDSSEGAFETSCRALHALLAGFPEEVRGEGYCRRGRIVDTLLTRSEPYDALVVGPRARRTWERMLLGTVAAQVVRRALRPVFVCRGEPLERGPRVLVGLDLNRKTHGHLLPRAAEWAQKLGGNLDAAYVDTQRLPLIREASLRRAAEQELKAERAQDRLFIAEQLQAVPAEIRGTARVEEGGMPGTKLVELSEEYDLLIVGSLERMGVVEHLLGSVAEFVVSRAHSNVLTFPANLHGG
jgi:nucleotide-binding universal stress UspA family protein